MRGVTTAFLKLLGTKPSASEQLTSLVMEGNRISTNSLTRKVGQGSRLQDFEGEASMTLWTYVSVTGEKCSRLAGGVSGGVDWTELVYETIMYLCDFVFEKRTKTIC